MGRIIITQQTELFTLLLFKQRLRLRPVTTLIKQLQSPLYCGLPNKGQA